VASTKYHEQRISTITYVDAESHFEECASQYPYDPSAGHVLGVSNLLFWSGIIIVVVAIGWIVCDWYIDRKNRSIRTEQRRKK
jgi:hypothetical protein